MNTFLMSCLVGWLYAICPGPTFPPKAAPFAVGMYAIGYSAKVRVMVNKLPRLSMHLRLVTTKKEILYETPISRSERHYSSLLNLEELPEGTYYLILTGGGCTVTRTLYVDPPIPVPIESTRTVSIEEE